MEYIALTIPVSDAQQAEILTAYLADYPFESFGEEEGLLMAYMPADALAAHRSGIEGLLSREGVAGRFERVETENWNAAWESDFPAVEVGDRLVIRAPFHAPAPDGRTEVVIRPRMSFGTGHHATTWLMARAVLDLKVAGRRGLDIGSGTGVLAIVAAKCGAASVDAVDIDDWADANCRENAARNGVDDRIRAMQGDASRIAGRHYGFILANICRNVLLADMAAYAGALEAGGDFVMSGFLEPDAPPVIAAGQAEGLRLVSVGERDGWMVVHMRKERA